MLHWVDIAIIVAYIIYSVWAGLGGAKKASENLEEYFLAGRSLKGWQAGTSMAATQFAADTPLVVTGLIATMGVFSLWRFWIYGLAFLLMALVLASCWRRSGVITDAQLTEFRYGGPRAAALRGFKAVYFGFVFNCTVLGMVLLATTRITEPFLVWDQWLPAGLHGAVMGVVEWVGYPLTASGAPCAAACEAAAQCLKGRCVGAAEWTASTNNILSIGAIVTVTTLYSTTGGLRSVVKTDIAQFVIAMVSTIAYAVILIAAVGGFGGLYEQLGVMFPADGSGPSGMTLSELLAFTPSEGHDIGFAFLGVIAIQWLCQLNADGSGYLAQRTMACRTEGDARTAGVVFTLLQVLVRSLVWLPIGLALLVLFQPAAGLEGTAFTAEREATYVRGIAEMVPMGLRGLMLTGMLGALASTVDTHLNWGSSYFTNDIYARFICPHWLKREPTQRGLVWVARVTNVGILAAGVVIMTQMDSIQTAWQASLLLGAGVGVLLVLRWLWWRMNATGELAALAASLVGAPTLIVLVDSDSLRLLLMALFATVVGVAAALLTPAEDTERLKAFYDKVRPPRVLGPRGGQRRGPAAPRFRAGGDLRNRLQRVRAAHRLRKLDGRSAGAVLPAVVGPVDRPQHPRGPRHHPAVASHDRQGRRAPRGVISSRAAC